MRASHRPGLSTPTGIGWPARAQAHDLGDADFARVLVVTSAGWEATVRLLAFERATRLWSYGAAPARGCRSHHDPVRAASLVRLLPASLADLRLFGITGFAPRIPFPERRPPAASDPPGAAGTRAILRATLSLSIRRRLDEPPREDRARLDPEAYGYPPFEGRDDGRPAVSVLPSADGSGTIHADCVVRLDAEGAGRLLAALVARAAADAAACHDERATAHLGARDWTAAAYARLSEPGESGRRRRQAAAVYPALAPMIVHDADTRAAVDGGTPFEEPLRAAAARLLDAGRRGGLTPAALRRLRGLSAAAGFPGAAAAVAVASRINLGRVPADPDGWAAVLEPGRALLSWADRWGLDPDDLLARSPGGWSDADSFFGHSGATERPAGAIPREGVRMYTSATDAEDVFERLANGFLIPLSQRLGPPLSDVPFKAAARLLAGGRSLPAIDRMQRAWHRGIAHFEAAMPSPERINSWPALFEPFTSAHGLLVACLTDEAMLRREGGHSVDADGMAGLAHCVGGYGPSCHAGEAHVVSVRRPGPDGTARLSTAELRLQGGGLVLVQHRGTRNADPPPEATAAIEELRLAISEGRLALDPRALERRDRAAFRDGLDWSRPETVAQAFDAWRPHLTRSAAAAGPEGVVDLLANGFPDPQKEA